MLYMLEDRVYFDGAAATTVVETQQDSNATLATAATDAASAATADHSADTASHQSANASSAAHTPSTVYFVDTTVKDYAGIVKDIPTNATVVYLSNGGDGVKEITDYLSSHSSISSVQIVSQGGDGQLVIGNDIVNGSTLSQYAGEIAAWGKSLTANGDISLYACNLAKDSAGKSFVNELALLTGADVAASENLTGVDGDWNLEYATGAIEADSITSSGYGHNLVTTWHVSSSADDGGSTTLRYAISHAGTSDIVDFSFSADTAITLETSSISISHDLAIQNTSGHAITLNGSSSVRIFAISGTGTDVSISGLTFQNATTSAITVDAGSSLTVAHCEFDNNSTNAEYNSDTGFADAGGAICVTGESGATTKLTVVDSTFSNNSNDAIYSRYASIDVDGSAFSSDSGGTAIYNLVSDMTINDSSFSNDTVYSGHHGNDAGGSVSIVACSFSGNSGNAIWLDSGKMTVSASTFENNTASAIHLEGGSSNASHAATLTINAGTTFINNSASYGGAIYVEPGTLNTLVINGTSFIGNSAIESTYESDGETVGQGGYGGAIYISCEARTVSIVNATFTGNHAVEGGEIYVSAFEANQDASNSACLNLAIAGSTFGAIDGSGNVVAASANYAFSEVGSATLGGAIHLGAGTYTATLKTSNFHGNYAGVISEEGNPGAGGAIYIDSYVTTSVNGSTFIANEAGWACGVPGHGGAAIYLAKDTTTTIDNSTFKAHDDSFAIYSRGSLSINHSAFSDNEGGAIWLDKATPTTVTISNSTFSDNNGNGAISSNIHLLSVVSCAFTGNSSEYGGAIYSSGGLSITGSTFTGNYATDAGGAIYEGIGATIGASTFTLSISNSNFNYNYVLPSSYDANTNSSSLSEGGAIYATIGEGSTWNLNVAVAGSVFTGNGLASNLAAEASTNAGGAICVDGQNASSSAALAMTVSKSQFLNGSAVEYGGGIYITHANSSVSGCTFKSNTSGNEGGAIINYGGTLAVDNSSFLGNSAMEKAGAIYESSGTLTVGNCVFSGNSAVYGGGAIHIAGLPSGTITISNSSFSANDATYGGAISNFSGALSLSHLTFTGNSAESYGGAIYANVYGTVSVANSTFTANTAATGGAIYNSGDADNASILTINAGTFFIGNFATSSGGAIYNSGTAAITSATFTNNYVSGVDSAAGGAIFSDTDSTLGVASSSFKGNRVIASAAGSNADGGAIFSTGASLTIASSSFTSNTAQLGGNGLGGAIYATSSSNAASIGNCAFTGNKSGNGGGAVAAGAGETMTIADSTFTGNASGKGGAIRNAGDLTISGTTAFASNISTSSGGAIYNDGTLTLNNATSFAGNKAAGKANSIYSSSAMTVAGTATIKDGILLDSASAILTLGTGATLNLAGASVAGSGAIGITGSDATSTILLGGNTALGVSTTVGSLTLSSGLSAISSAVTVNANLTLASGAFSLSGSIALGSSAALINGHGVIGGSGALTTNGDVTLQATNIGTLNINAGTVTLAGNLSVNSSLSIGAAGTLKLNGKTLSSAGALENHGVIDGDSAATICLTGSANSALGAIDEIGKLAISGSGTVAISGITIDRTLSIAKGILMLDSSSTTLTIANGATISIASAGALNGNGGTLDVKGNLSLPKSSFGSIIVATGKTVMLTGALELSGISEIDGVLNAGAYLTLTGASINGSGAVNSSTLTVSSNSEVTCNLTVTKTLSIATGATLAGTTGTLTLQNVTGVSAGSLSVENLALTGSGSFNTANVSGLETLTVNRGAAMITVSSSLVLNHLIVYGSANISGAIDADALTVASGSFKLPTSIADLASLTIGKGATLTMQGDLSVHGLGNTGTLNAGIYVLTLNGVDGVTTGTLKGAGLTLIDSSITLNANLAVGALSIDANSSLTLNGKTLSVSGTLSNSGAIVGDTQAALTIAGGGASSLGALSTIGSLTVNNASAAVSLNNNLTITKTLAVTQGTLDIGSKELSIASGAVVNGKGSIVGTSSGILTFNGIGNSSITSLDIGTLNIDRGSGSITATGTVNVTTLSLGHDSSSKTFFSAGSYALALGSTPIVNGMGKITVSNLALTGTVALPSCIATLSTLTLNDAMVSSSSPVKTTTLNVSSNSSMTCNLTVTKTLSIATGATLAGTTGTLTLQNVTGVSAGSLSVENLALTGSGSFNTANVTGLDALTVNRGSAIITLPGSLTLSQLTVYGAANIVGIIDTDGLTVASGSFKLPASIAIDSLSIAKGAILTMQGDLSVHALSNAGTLNACGHTLTLNDVTSSATGTIAAARLTLVNSSVTLNANLAVNALSLDSASALMLNSKTLTVAGALDNEGAIAGADSAMAITGSGTANLGNVSTLASLTLNRAATTVTLGNSLTISKSLTLANGYLDIGANDLTLGAAATAGAGSKSSFVYTSETGGDAGFLSKVFSKAGKFTYGVGAYDGSHYNYQAGAISTATKADTLKATFDSDSGKWTATNSASISLLSAFTIVSGRKKATRRIEDRSGMSGDYSRMAAWNLRFVKHPVFKSRIDSLLDVFVA